MRFCPTCQRCFQSEILFCLYDQAPTREVRDVPLVLEGKYRLERLIAHGGMGSVYRGVHEQLERPVAIKILRAEFLQDDTIRARFHREALTAARLKHPNLIAVYDFGSLPDGGAYLVMELVEGRSLREEMRLNAARNGQMRPERAAAILRQVCAGIEAAHQAGVIHRDLKPDNIMIEPQAAHDFSGSSERVLVLDFGIAKLKQLEGAWQGLTDENVIIGTPNYISPEQCAGAPVEGRSDIYALGVILYEMLTGRVPFNNISTSAVLLSHLQDTPLPPTKYRPDLPPAVERVMLRALAKNPAQRFASAMQFSDALTRALMIPSRSETEEEWPNELAVMMPTPQEVEVLAEITTRPRQPRVSVRANESYVPTTFAEPSIPDGKIARRFFVTNDGNTQENELEPDVPQFLIERPRRRGMGVMAALLLLSFVVALAWIVDLPLPRFMRDRVQFLNNSSTAVKDIPPPATEAATTNAPALVPASAVVEPAASPKPETPSAAVMEKEARDFYRKWAQTALDQNWEGHALTYAPEVNYYRDGSVSRSNVIARKQRVLSGLQRMYIKFTPSPQITLREREGVPEAELVFDKTWDLLRGKARSTGKAQTQLILRRLNTSETAGQPGWQIIAERQVKLYPPTISAEEAKFSVANAPKKGSVVKPRRPASTIRKSKIAVSEKLPPIRHRVVTIRKRP